MGSVQQATSTEMNFTPQQIELLKHTICKGPTYQGKLQRPAYDEELDLFLSVARRSGLDPFQRQIYAVWHYDKSIDDHKMTVITGIDGFRLKADRSGKYEGQIGPLWCGPDGHWRDVWLENAKPRAAKVGVLKSGFREPLWQVAHWAESGGTNRMWNDMPAHMLAKCAEAMALRRAFPEDLSGLYTKDEIDRGDVEQSSAAQQSKQRPRQQRRQLNHPPQNGYQQMQQQQRQPEPVRNGPEMDQKETKAAQGPQQQRERMGTNKPPNGDQQQQIPQRAGGQPDPVGDIKRELGELVAQLGLSPQDGDPWWLAGVRIAGIETPRKAIGMGHLKKARGILRERLGEGVKA